MSRTPALVPARLVPLVVSSAIVLPTTTAGSAAASPTRGLSVTAGVSPSGQQWRQRASVQGRDLVLDTSFPMDGGDGGATQSFPWRSRDRLDVSQGGGFGSADEWEVDGVVFRTVAAVRVTTIDGRTTTFRPRRAPRAAVRRYPQLARFRFFVRFFPNDRQPLTVEALSPRGRQMAEQRVGLP